VIRKYYYLSASLPDLFRGRTTGAGSLEEYLRFCSETLHAEDYATLKQIFLYNDVQNAVECRDSDDPFIGPSFFDRRELLAIAEEPSPEIPFIGRYLSNRSEQVRLHPEMTELDEAITLFYEGIEQVNDPFIHSYFLHELDLRNIATALELRSNEFSLAHRLIPLGEAYEQLITSDENDWGLAEEFPFVKTLMPFYEDSDLSARESALDEIRWQWWDDATQDDLFTFHAIVAYGIKLLSVERWSKLDETAGNELFMELLGTVQRSVRFAIEFANLSDEQREERRRQMEAERHKAEQVKAGEEGQ
jgi:hypothetical protein